MKPMRGDAGRFPVGALVAIAVVGAAAFGAYWALGEYGFLGEPEATDAEAPVEQDAGEEDSRPEWLQDTSRAMPAVAPAHEDDRMPTSYELEPWIWDLVDEDWDLTVVRVGEGDQYTWFSDVQELYLVSPTEEMFRVAEFDTTVNRDVVHWDPALHTSWIRRSDGSGYEQVIEFDVVELENTGEFTGGSVSSANRVEGGVANIDVMGVQPDGLELWISYDEVGDTTGVFWRDGDSWISSLIQDQIRRMVLQGMAQERGVKAWIDVPSSRAVYYGAFVDPDLGTVTEQMWITHDLATDSFDDTAVVQVPSTDCEPTGEGRAGVFEGDLIVAQCGGSEYLLDPYGNTDPQQR